MEKMGFEAERLFLLPNEETFILAMEDMLPNEVPIKQTNVFSQTSIYMDTPNYALCRNNSSLVFRPAPENRVGAILKHGFCSLITERLLVRAEMAALTEAVTMNLSEEMSQRVCSLIGDEMEKFDPVLVVRQQRHHRITIDLNPIVHFSFDQVTYTNPISKENCRFFMLELEVTNTDLSALKGSQINQFSNYYRDRYRARPIYPSKYLYGLLNIGSNKDQLQRDGVGEGSPILAVGNVI
ncbi:hypothetical protein EN829_033280 [Mesorhizobium sp. M00.F.Ca.ET.186.01.1.1]|nr:hypothetical protein EN829_033280 [Mesorhizobium sp. M00.F.Ca.ET.186.01.1.1]